MPSRTKPWGGGGEPRPQTPTVCSRTGRCCDSMENPPMCIYEVAFVHWQARETASVCRVPNSGGASNRHGITDGLASAERGRRVTCNTNLDIIGFC